MNLRIRINYQFKLTNSIRSWITFLYKFKNKNSLWIQIYKTYKNPNSGQGTLLLCSRYAKNSDLHAVKHFIT